MTNVLDVQQFAGLDLNQPDSVLLRQLYMLGRSHASTVIPYGMDIEITTKHVVLDHLKGQTRKYTHRQLLRDLRAAVKEAPTATAHR